MPISSFDARIERIVQQLQKERVGGGEFEARPQGGCGALSALPQKNNGSTGHPARHIALAPVASWAREKLRHALKEVSSPETSTLSSPLENFQRAVHVTELGLYALRSTRSAAGKGAPDIEAAASSAIGACFRGEQEISRLIPMWTALLQAADRCEADIAATPVLAPRDTVTDCLQEPTATVAGMEAANGMLLSNGVCMPWLGVGVYGVPRERCKAAVLQALREGIRCVDTAQAYGTEAEVGAALTAAVDEGLLKERGEVFVTVKLRDDAWGSAEAAVAESLARLGIPAADLLLVHHPPREGPAAAAVLWREVERLYEAGYARAVGIANFGAEDLLCLLKAARISPHAAQLKWSPYHQGSYVDPQGEAGRILELYRAYNVRLVGISLFNPLFGNFLCPLDDPVVAQIAQRHSRTPAQVLVRWRWQCGLCGLIRASTCPGRAKDVLEAGSDQLLTLEDCEVQKVSALEWLTMSAMRPAPQSRDAHGIAVAPATRAPNIEPLAASRNVPFVGNSVAPGNQAPRQPVLADDGHSQAQIKEVGAKLFDMLTTMHECTRQASGQATSTKQAGAHGQQRQQQQEQQQQQQPQQLAATLTPAAMERAGEILGQLMRAGSLPAMMDRLEQLVAGNELVPDDPALLSVVDQNLRVAEERGYKVKAQVFSKLLEQLHRRSDAEKKRREPTTQESTTSQRRDSGVALPPQVAKPAKSHAPRLFTEDTSEQVPCLSNLNPASFLSCIKMGSPGKREEHLVAEVLESKGWAVLENFADVEFVDRLLKEIRHLQPHYETSEVYVGKGDSGAQLHVPNVRGDSVLWMCGEHTDEGVRDRLFDSAGVQPRDQRQIQPCQPELLKQRTPIEKFAVLQRLLKSMDTFVLKGLRSLIPRLSGLVERSDAMLARYPPGGSRFVKHIDNTTVDGRKLTMLVYLNAKWTKGDGGELRIFPPGTNGQVTVEPLAGRAVFFYADTVPHEVLPSWKERFACTLWYFDNDERRAAVQRRQEAVATSTAEGSQQGDLQISDELAARKYLQRLLAPSIAENPTVSDVKMLASEARRLPVAALSSVARSLGAPNGAEVADAVEALQPEQLAELRAEFGRMGVI